jgi:hypothetical protein
MMMENVNAYGIIALMLREIVCIAGFLDVRYAPILVPTSFG